MSWVTGKKQRLFLNQGWGWDEEGGGILCHCVCLPSVQTHWTFMKCPMWVWSFYKCRGTGNRNMKSLFLNFIQLFSPLLWATDLGGGREKEMATHSSVLAWRIPGIGEPGGLPSMGSHRVGHVWSNLAAAAAADLESTHQRTLGKPLWILLYIRTKNSHSCTLRTFDFQFY